VPDAVVVRGRRLRRIRSLALATAAALAALALSAASAQAVSGSLPLPRELRGTGSAAAALRDPVLRGLLARLMVRNDSGRELFGGHPRQPVAHGPHRALVEFPGRRVAPAARLDVAVDAVARGVTAVTVRPPRGLRPREVGLRLPIRRGERFFGLGERFGSVELRGQVIDNWVQDRVIDPRRRTSYSPMPLLLSSRGWGLLLDSNARARFDVGARTPGLLRVRAYSGVLRVWLIRADDLKGVVSASARLVGTAPLVPRWGLGVWKTLIGGERRALADLARLRAHGVPLHAAWTYDLVEQTSGVGWRWPIYGPIPPGPYPRPARFVAALHRRGLKVLGYLNPFVYADTPLFDRALERDLLLDDGGGRPLLGTWRPHPRTQVRHGTVDLSDPLARKWFGARVRHALVTLGLDGAMQDFGEGLPARAVPTGPARAALAHNRYPVEYAHAVRQAAEEVKPGQTVFFARSGYLGAQSASTGRFTGDQERSWHPERGLPSVVRAMISGSLSGWPYWGPDIAGFTTAPDTVRDEKELWIRWAQLGALSPVMRDMLGAQRHAVDALTDAETLAVFRAYARLHTALMPYLHRQARAAHERGLPIIRPLFLEHPDDPDTLDIDDQYLLGPDVLVAPVLRPQHARRRLYLPRGRWTDYWTGRTITGARWVTLPAPRHRIPLLIRADSELRLPAPRTLWRSRATPRDRRAATLPATKVSRAAPRRVSR